mmetsp:Transcript_16245/g.50615  ORF Transcript_16245/g.50615 Transcript_16245/m.50615 type:complete len:275 (-) Transcript_16245:303-1127(-)
MYMRKMPAPTSVTHGRPPIARARQRIDAQNARSTPIIAVARMTLSASQLDSMRAKEPIVAMTSSAIAPSDNAKAAGWPCTPTSAKSSGRKKSRKTRTVPHRLYAAVVRAMPRPWRVRRRRPSRRIERISRRAPRAASSAADGGGRVAIATAQIVPLTTPKEAHVQTMARSVRPRRTSSAPTLFTTPLTPIHESETSATIASVRARPSMKRMRRDHADASAADARKRQGTLRGVGSAPSAKMSEPAHHSTPSTAPSSCERRSFGVRSAAGTFPTR